jgi:hypothetical protein
VGHGGGGTPVRNSVTPTPGAETNVPGLPVDPWPPHARPLPTLSPDSVTPLKGYSLVLCGSLGVDLVIQYKFERTGVSSRFGVAQMVNNLDWTTCAQPELRQLQDRLPTNVFLPAEIKCAALDIIASLLRLWSHLPLAGPLACPSAWGRSPPTAHSSRMPTLLPQTTPTRRRRDDTPRSVSRARYEYSGSGQITGYAGHLSGMSGLSVPTDGPGCARRERAGIEITNAAVAMAPGRPAGWHGRPRVGARRPSSLPPRCMPLLPDNA